MAGPKLACRKDWYIYLYSRIPGSRGWHSSKGQGQCLVCRQQCRKDWCWPVWFVCCRELWEPCWCWPCGGCVWCWRLVHMPVLYT